MRRMDRREVLAGAAALGLAGAGGRPAFAADRNLRVHTGGAGISHNISIQFITRP